MAIIRNLKHGTIRSTKRILPDAFSDGKRIRFIGDGHIPKIYDNSICGDAGISCPPDENGESIIQVECDNT